jgi:UDP-2,3-diacylglucosamine hydrolase
MSDNLAKIYFASDFHLGAPDMEASRKREKNIVNWLDSISDATELYLLGDLFDFWFEYNKVVPKGFVRLLGKLATMSDNGVKITIFLGNHDLWMKKYFTQELNATIVSEPIVKEFNGQKFYLAHGDGLGPGDHGYKFINKIFKSRFNQFLFKWLHPDIGIGLANYFSSKSRAIHYENDHLFHKEKEWLIIHSRNLLKQEHFDYFIYGHRHFPIKYQLGENSYYVNLGDWIQHFTYAVFDGSNLELKIFE